MTPTVRNILKAYEGEFPGVKSALGRLLSHGTTGGSGRLVILPVDQGFEHGPDRSFAGHPIFYDPHAHFNLAIEGGVSALVAPLGFLESGADTFITQIPLILKINSSNTLTHHHDQAITGSVKDALRLGCIGIGITVYPGSPDFLNQLEEVRVLIQEAKSVGLFTMIWSYPRGDLSKVGAQSIDVVAYGAHMACLMGAHIVKVKLPTEKLEKKQIKEAYHRHKIPIYTLIERIAHIRKVCFEGRRLVVFSGGEKQPDAALLEDVNAILEGGGHGSIIGRNAFQRSPEKGALLLKQIGQTYAQHS